MDAFHEHGFDEAYVDEVGNAIGVFKRGDGPTLMLCGHLDTVPLGDEDRWPHPPLSGVVEDGRLWGRGTCDMKSALACMVFAAADAAAAGFAGTLIVSGVVQEEVGGMGARHLGATLDYDAVVLGEPSKLRLMLGHRGCTVIEVVFPGAIAHAAKASLGENALAHAARYVMALEGIELPEGGVLGGSSATPTRLASSPADSSNVVPGEARLTVDYRSLPDESVAAVLERLRGIRHDERISVNVARDGLRGKGEESLRTAPAYLVDGSLPVVDMAREAFARALARHGRPFEEGVWWFCTDAPHLAQRGAPVLGFGPGEEELAHTTNESIAVADLHAARDAYSEFVITYLSEAQGLTDGQAANDSTIERKTMKGKNVTINGDPWTIVDVAPGAPLAEMVAAILEDEGMVSMVRGADMLSDVFSHLGSTSVGASYVLVPEVDGERAMRIIAETVTDYEGDELDDLLERMAAGEVPEELAPDDAEDDLELEDGADDE